MDFLLRLVLLAWMNGSLTEPAYAQDL